MKNRKPQKPDPQSVSTEAGLAATTRYPSGRPVGGETFLLTSPFIERLWSLVNLWDVRDESLMVVHFLDVPGRVARVYQQAVHLDHPGHGIVFHPAWQCPFRVELINLEHLANGQRLCLTGALGHPEGPIDFYQLHVWSLARVVEKIDDAYCPNDSGRPGVRRTTAQRRRSFARKLLGELLAQESVFLVQEFRTKAIRHCCDCLKSFTGFIWRWRSEERRVGKEC